MIEMTLREIAAVTGGTLAGGATGDERVTGTVEFDSRKVTVGGLFVALPGERVDGHDFAATATESGAAGVLAAREVGVPSVLAAPVAAAHGGVYALAGDTDGSGATVLAAMAALAHHVASTLTTRGMTIVGVTGSAGKTSTKDLIGALLEPLGPTVTPPGSFNAEIGVPWTVLRADAGTRFLILEMAARGVGHIASLCRMAPPSIGAVLNVGSSHLDEFGSPEAVAAAKGELPAALPASGTAVLNLDDPRVAAMKTSATVLGFGTGEDATDAAVRAVDVTADELARPRFTLRAPDGEAKVELALHGAHQVSNALAAAAVALTAGAGVDQVAAGLSAATPRSGKRMAVQTTPGDVLLIDDTYNASPEAVRSALRSLATIAGSGTRQRKSWAVLGPMAELGDAAAQLHEGIGGLAASLGVTRVVTVGEAARPTYDGAVAGGAEATAVADADAAVALLRTELRPSDVVLVKAANSLGFWRIADALRTGPPATEATEGETQ